MINRRRTAAPNAEWVLMYRGGLTQAKIAEVTGASPATVAYHLAAARAADPTLQDAHDDASAGKSRRVTVQGLTRMRELVSMVQETGRYPSRQGSAAEERSLAAWLQTRRREARAGTIAREFREGLQSLRGWQGTPRGMADESQWQDRLAALAQYRENGHDWPRHKATATDEEHSLGVWLHYQRSKHRRGELDPARVHALNESVPGWRTGRQRGRKPRNGPGKLADEA